MYYFINIIIEEASSWEKILLVILGLDSSAKVLLKWTKSFTTIISKRVGNVYIDLMIFLWCSSSGRGGVLHFISNKAASISINACLVYFWNTWGILFILAKLIFYLDFRHFYIAVTGGCERLWLDETIPMKAKKNRFFSIYNTKIVYTKQEEEETTTTNILVNENTNYFRVELWEKKHKLLSR